MGPMLERLDIGLGPSERYRAPGAGLSNADDIVHVRAALERAYAADHHRLPQAECTRVLLERTSGLLPELTPYATLTVRYGLSAGDLQSIVRRGQRSIEDDLVARGLVAVQRRRAPVTESAGVWSAADAF